MTSRNTLWRVLFVALLAAGPQPVSADPQQQAPASATNATQTALSAEIARTFSSRMPIIHLGPVPQQQVLSERAMRLFLNSLDGDHTIFLASDIAGAKARERDIYSMLKNGDTSFASEMIGLLRKRVAERCEYVDSLLKQGVDTNTSAEIQRDRRNAPWPADVTEQNELWKKKITDQYIRLALDAEFRKKKGEKKDRKPEKGRTEKDSLAPTNTVGAVTNGAAASTNAAVAAVPGIKAPTNEEQISKRYRQLLTVLTDMDADTIFQQYLSSFARAYDPHSDYMSPNTAEDFDISMRLSLVGIGALLSSEDGAAKIVRVLPGGAAARDGRLKPGDKIIAVGQGDAEPVDILHWPLAKTVRLIRGQKGTKVVLMVIPSEMASSAVVRIDIVRDDVKLEEAEGKGTVREVKKKGGAALKLGVVSLPSFYSDLKARSNGSGEYTSSARDMKRILGDMIRTNAQGIVLDLRNNGGGSLPEAIEMTGLFIKAGPVVQVKDRRGISVLQDQDPAVVYDGPLVVLVDRMSASASEILAAALQDYGRAVIVGDSRTHGKGTVQSVVDLKNGKPECGSLKVTTATFYRFTGRSTQRDGVTSDIQVSSPLDGMEIGEEYLECPLPWSEIPAVDFDRHAARGLLEDLLFWKEPKEIADFQMVADLKPLIAGLKKKSEERRSKDPRFVARETLLKKFGVRQKTATVPLNMDERREQANEEMRLDELQKVAQDDEAEDDVKKSDSGPDLVLEEALNILSDMVAEISGH